MNLRKVIKFGKATYSITLPKEWVVDNNIEKGDVLRVEQMATGKLEVSPNSKEKTREVKETTIEAEGKTYDDIFREIVAAYIKNYTIINITGNVTGKIKDIRKGVQEFMGLEIMEVGPEKITAKSFMDVTETKIQQTIKRVFYTIKSMSNELKTCFKKCEKNDEIQEMDREINRNTLFMMKYLFKALEEPELASDMNMTNQDILFTWEVVKLLESIADKIKMMAEIAGRKETLVEEESTKEFLKLYEAVEQNFYFAMEQYFKKSKKEVHDIFVNVDENESKCNEFLSGNKTAWTPLLIDHLKDVNMFTRGISEIIVDL